MVVEGAQATLLDIDFGSYPYVTSSNPTIGGILTGTGLSASDIGNVYGVIKAYSSRVGEGPYVTELLDATGVSSDMSTAPQQVAREDADG